MTAAQGRSGLPLAALEIALNRLLALDPLTLQRLAALQGRVIRLEVPALGWRLVCAPQANGLQWLPSATWPVDAHISGGLADLLRAQAGGGLAGLQIEGDKHLASAFAAALRAARIDWPELLAPWLGDLATQRGLQALSGLAEALREGAASLLRSGAEFLQYERPVLVSAAEWASFKAELRAFYEALGALERRLALLALRRQ